MVPRNSGWPPLSLLPLNIGLDCTALTEASTPPLAIEESSPASQEHKLGGGGGETLYTCSASSSRALQMLSKVVKLIPSSSNVPRDREEGTLSDQIGCSMGIELR